MIQADAPPCPDCGTIMVRNLGQYTCLNCNPDPTPEQRACRIFEPFGFRLSCSGCKQKPLCLGCSIAAEIRAAVDVKTKHLVTAIQDIAAGAEGVKLTYKGPLWLALRKAAGVVVTK